MTTYEFALLDEAETILQIGLVEAESFMEAVREIGEFHQADPDTAYLQVGLKGTHSWSLLL